MRIFLGAIAGGWAAGVLAALTLIAIDVAYNVDLQVTGYGYRHPSGPNVSAGMVIVIVVLAAVAGAAIGAAIATARR